MTVTFDEFKKFEFRVGTITTAERVEGSEKLLKLSVDIGDETRQIIAGIGKAYAPETLRGIQIAVVVNIEPRTLMGHESRGMLLAGDMDGVPVLLHPDREMPPGSVVR